MKYYAGYDFVDTDIAVFDTEEERDDWINFEFSAFKRVPFTEKEAFDIVGKKHAEYVDELGIRWLINSLNII